MKILAVEKSTGFILSILKDWSVEEMKKQFNGVDKSQILFMAHNIYLAIK